LIPRAKDELFEYEIDWKFVKKVFFFFLSTVHEFLESVTVTSHKPNRTELQCFRMEMLLRTRVVQLLGGGRSSYVNTSSFIKLHATYV
jgi:hypothetical protein